MVSSILDRQGVAMEKSAHWNGRTKSHGFEIDVVHDPKTGEYVARIQTSSPALVPQIVPRAPTPVMQFDEPLEVRHPDLGGLREITKKRYPTAAEHSAVLRMKPRLGSA